MKNKLLWFFKSFIWLFILLFAIDMVTKLVILNNMVPGQSIELIPNFLRITLSFNEKAAFGMGFNDPNINRWVYIVVATIATSVILYFYIRKFKTFNMYVKACLMLMLTGALGNLMDRLFYAKSGYCVVDWIDFCGIWRFIFNIADSGVVVGTIMLVVYLIVQEVKDYKAAKANEPKVEGKVLSKVEQEKNEHLKDEEKVDN